MNRYLVFYKWNNDIKYLPFKAKTEKEVYEKINDVEIIKICEEPFRNQANFMQLRTQFIIDTANELKKLINITAD